jgi:hypothetical protein
MKGRESERVPPPTTREKTPPDKFDGIFFPPRLFSPRRLRRRGCGKICARVRRAQGGQSALHLERRSGRRR